FEFYKLLINIWNYDYIPIKKKSENTMLFYTSNKLKHLIFEKFRNYVDVLMNSIEFFLEINVPQSLEKASLPIMKSKLLLPPMKSKLYFNKKVIAPVLNVLPDI